MAKRTTYQILFRLLTRAKEVALEPDISKGIQQVYTNILEPVSKVYLANYEAFTLCRSKAGAARAKAASTLARFEPIYGEVRAIVLAFEPDVALPDTLKSQSTDTDIVTAITALTKIVTSHKAEVWAEDQLKGEFGSLGPKLIAELNESITASKALIKAREARASSYGPAYDKYLSFKQVVRSAMGASSAQYMRLRLRAKPSRASEEQVEEAAPDSGVLPYDGSSRNAA